MLNSITEADMFQSLFLWKYVSGRDDDKEMTANQIRFNPCFCGSTSQVFTPFIASGNIYEFQSLFLWKYVSGIRQGYPDDRDVDVSILVFVEVRLR